MAKQITNRIANFKMEINPQFVETAEKLKPQLHTSIVTPTSIVTIQMGAQDWEVAKQDTIDALSETELGKGERACLDFGDHRVGYVTLTIKPVGSPPDAPAYIRLKFAEILPEIGEQSENYQGSISGSWIQEEYLHLDILPCTIALPRRYAFRYLEILVKDTSPKYRIAVEKAECRCVTSASSEKVRPIASLGAELTAMDKVALKTMEDCMQDVFEDGPKRDRRLWIGDLRLQAQTNYLTFQDYALVKRCLYLFAGLRQNEGRVGACLFIAPDLLVDDTALFDYSLFFISCLYDYYEATNDLETLIELWPVAYHQAELAMERVDPHTGVVRDSEEWWCFLDWHDALNKQGGAQGVLVYALRQALCLANRLEHSEQVGWLDSALRTAVSGALSLWDDEQRLFVSGTDRQVSWATQVWMVLAEVLSPTESRDLLLRLIDKNPKVGMVTPYMYHHFVEALFATGQHEKAVEYMSHYWGGMLALGADTFWELYDPENPYTSPYGGRIVNSYCHAWSCGPAYFIRKYIL